MEKIKRKRLVDLTMKMYNLSHERLYKGNLREYQAITIYGIYSYLNLNYQTSDNIF